MKDQVDKLETAYDLYLWMISNAKNNDNWKLKMTMKMKGDDLRIRNGREYRLVQSVIGVIDTMAFYQGEQKLIRFDEMNESLTTLLKNYTTQNETKKKPEQAISE